jgi:hypothetical protein
MSSAEPRSTGRETRLLLVTIAVAVAALLLLARFRFPEQALQPAEPAPAPLERLAARAAFDELASAMADLERRIYPRVLLYRVTPARPSGSYVVAPRLTGSRAVLVLDENESLDAVSAGVDLVTHRTDAGVAVLNVPAAEEPVVTSRTSAVRTGPRYVAVVEGTAQGPTLRPLYVGRTAMNDNVGGPLALLTMHGLQAHVAHGAAIFSLDGSFLGLVNASGTSTSVFSAESLRTLTETAQPQTSRRDSDLGVEVQNADQRLLRAAASERGVVITYVRRGGPTESELRPGDVIRSVDELETHDTDAYKRAARTRIPGEPTTIKFTRRGTEQQVTVRARAAVTPAAVAGIGIEGRSVPRVGVEVVAVEPEGPAAQAGLRRGDLILTIDGEPLADLGRLLRAYRAVNVGTALVLSIERDTRHLTLAVEKR